MSIVPGCRFDWGWILINMVLGVLRWMAKSSWMHRLNRREEDGGMTAYSASAAIKENVQNTG